MSNGGRSAPTPPGGGAGRGEVIAAAASTGSCPRSVQSGFLRGVRLLRVEEDELAALQERGRDRLAA